MMSTKSKSYKSQRLAMPKKATRKFGAALARSKLAPHRQFNNSGGRNGPAACMTTEELCRYDDMCTALTIDPYMGFQTHKMNIRFRPLSNQSELKKIIEEFIHDQDYEKAHDSLLAVDPRRVAHLIKTERDQNLMRQHIYCFLKMFDKDAGFEIKPCQRYSSEGYQGGKLVATKAWRKNDVISMLVGCVGEMTPAQERELLVAGQNDFSVMWSNRKKRSQLWLGPAAYMNHDCRPNCLFRPVRNTASLQVIRDIATGDEIVLSYGEGFFGVNNCNCECRTCEKLKQGKFKEDEAGETRERLRQIPSRMCTRAERALALSNSPTKMFTSSRGNSEDQKSQKEETPSCLKKPKVTRYDAKYIIQGNQCLPELSPCKPITVQQTASQGSLIKSQHNNSHSKTAAEQHDIYSDLFSKSTSSDLSASLAPGVNSVCTPSNPCVPRGRGKRASSQAHKSAPKRRRLSRPERGDENQPVIKEEVLSECESGEAQTSLWEGKNSGGPELDLATGSTTVQSMPLSSRRNSVHGQSQSTFAQLPNGRLSSHLSKNEPVRQSPRLRSRHASGHLPVDYGDNSCAEVLGGNYATGIIEDGVIEHPPLDSDVDNDDSGLGEMTGDVFDKSLDSNHNFHDPPVLEPEVPYVSQDIHATLNALPHTEEESDQELNKSSSSVPHLSFCGPVESFTKVSSPSHEPIPQVKSQKRKQRPMKLRIKLEHPDPHKLRDFNQQLEREGKSQFVQIEPKETSVLKPARSVAETARLTVESVQPPVRLRLRSDKSGKVFKCLSPRPAVCMS